MSQEQDGATTRVPVGGTWTPRSERQYEAVTLDLTAREVWLHRVVPTPAGTEAGAPGCRQRETHPGEPCTYALEPRNRLVDGRCLTLEQAQAPPGAD